MANRLITQELGAELLVYDLADHRAYALDEDRARSFREAPTYKARRAVLAGAIAAGLSLLAPTTAQACSDAHATNHCGKGESGRACVRGDGSCGRCFGGACR